MARYMHESFNTKISEKIKQGFDNHQEAFKQADWEKMKAKLAGQKERPVIWLKNLSKAAVLILLISLAALTMQRIYFSDEESASKFIPFDSEITLLRTPKETHEATHVQNITANNAIYQNFTQTDSIGKKNIENENIDNQNIIALLNDTTRNMADSVIKIGENEPDTADINTENIVVFNNDNFIQPQTKDNTNRLTVGVEMSSHYNYSPEVSTGTMNFGGGVVSEIKITDRISVSTGVLIARNEVDFGGSKRGLFNFSELYNQNNLNSEDMSSTNVVLYGLDVPLNVQYNFNNFFISGGISSMTYISEKYKNTSYTANEFTYTDPLTGETEIQVTYEENTVNNEFKAFRKFDLAKIINFSIGCKIPVKKGEIVVEPFIKYPIDKLASEDILFGSGGLSVRYNF